MVKFFSKSELDSLKSDNKNSHTTGEIYPQIFSHDEDLEFSEDMTLGAGIIWLGSYKLENKLFPREKCPVCGREEVLIPYKTVGSVLSGYHTINFFCTSCGEKFVTNDHIDYFRKIYKYIVKNRKKFSADQKLNNCTSAPENAEFITKAG